MQEETLYEYSEDYEDTPIQYSHMDYILVRTDAPTFPECEVNVSLYSFGTLADAIAYTESDVRDTATRFNTDINNIERSEYCGNDYWYYSDDDVSISWEIRKIHHRTTSKWDDPDYPVRWIKEKRLNQRS